MQLVTYIQHGTRHVGILFDRQSILDVHTAYAAFLQHTRQSAHAAFPLATHVVGLLEQGEPALKILADLVAFSQELVAGLETAERSPAWLLPAESIRLTAPIPNPQKVVAIGQNYRDHCAEQGVEPPERPIIFAKFPTSIIGPGEAITWEPELTAQVDYEAELAVVIGKIARNVSQETAFEYVAGYLNANDVSARDLQFGDRQWVRGKSLDTFCPIGPALVTKDEIPNPHALAIRAMLNGKIMQDSNTSNLIFNIPALIAFISRAFTLLPGDIILTGTPPGVGVFRNPKVLLKPGDTITIEVEGLGQLTNPVVAWRI
jgi:2-keto-4-pentenoate hydratase/2-oxohepta-3-ene-1,7-dioic acid hydratase in catechol pathway